MTSLPSDPELSLQQRIGYSFKNVELLRQALTHSSWANEYNHPGEHNERLEFLGDAVLELAISTCLYHRYPRQREGTLTKVRASLVRESCLAELGKKLGIPEALRLGRGEEQQCGRQRESLLADALEAVLAAVYLDGGYEAAKGVVDRIFPASEQSGDGEGKNPKCALQELCQKYHHDVPVYTLLQATGPDHARIFEVRLELPNGRYFHGIGSSRKRAEQAAAEAALAALTGEELPSSSN